MDSAVLEWNKNIQNFTDMINDKDDEDILWIMLSASKILIWKKQMIRITKLPGGWSVLDVILFYYKFYMDLMFTSFTRITNIVMH